ncbi:MAG: HlyD family efflux transporter periplasmic adaptor subunit [Pseudomonadota bacterium]
MLFRKEAVEASQDRLHGEVVFTQPFSTKLFAGALFATLMVAAVWVTVGTFARIETVPGVLKTDIPSAKVIAPQTGVVIELAVSEGQLVEQGDTLLVINSDRETAAGGDVAGRGIGALEARKELSEVQVSLASSRASAERSRLTSVIASAEDQAASLSEQIALQDQVVTSNQEIFDRVAEVVEQGFVSRVEFERRRQTLLSSQQSLATLKQRRTASLAEASQARSQLASVKIDAAQGISRIQENLQTMSAEQARLEGEKSYVIKAPITGRVATLATGEGRAVPPARPLMVIVPTEAKLTAELYAPTRSIGFVEPGKETRLLYDAFPYQRFGSFEGRVDSISRIAVDPRETEIPFPFEEPVYRVKVTLENQAVEGFGEPAPLQPGMTLQANIVLERQSFLAWLLKPLNAVLNRTS